MMEKYFRFTVPASVCDSILEAAVGIRDSGSIDAKVDGIESPDHEKRKTEIVWLPHSWYDGVMTECGMSGNAAWGYDVTGGEDIQVGWYVDGGHYGMHPDVDVFNDEKPYHRKVTVVMCLSDEYTGGELELMGCGKFVLEKGDVVVFPSFLQHQVHPVTGGLRVTAVKWLTGPYFR